MDAALCGTLKSDNGVKNLHDMLLDDFKEYGQPSSSLNLRVRTRRDREDVSGSADSGGEVASHWDGYASQQYRKWTRGCGGGDDWGRKGGGCLYRLD
ncbi:hypothetical protein J002_06260 [Cryptococcus neoformans]|nr:hypothetical protein J002_06260 [Cryptococcus neoformans var. grubii]OXH64460.1 hypothetical protein J000_06259 [Cryptococcus neoformans var. grubii]